MADSFVKRFGISFPLLLAGGMCIFMASCRYHELGIRSVDDSLVQGSSTYFPQITAKNLNGDEVTLPDALAGNPGLVLVAFKQRQQTNVNTWLFQLERIESMIEGVQVIETPTISGKKWGWMAGFIDNGMRSGIPDLEGRARTITLFTDVGAFREALGLETEDSIYAVMLDEQSRVVDVVEGDFSDEKLERLTEALE